MRQQLLLRWSWKSQDSTLTAEASNRSIRMSFIEKGGSRYDMIYDTCSWEVDMIYDTCSWRPLYVEAQHGIRTLYGGVTRFGCLTLLLESCSKHYSEIKGYYGVVDRMQSVSLSGRTSYRMCYGKDYTLKRLGNKV